MCLLAMFDYAQILGVSAAKIRYPDGQHDMAEELFEGCIASKITQDDAIVRGILPTPVYVITIYRIENELEAYQRRINGIQSTSICMAKQMHMDEFRRAPEDTDGLDEVFERHIKNKKRLKSSLSSTWNYYFEVASSL